MQEGDNAADVVGLRNALERLHPKDELASGVRLGETRHIGLDHTGRHRIDADPTGAKQRGKPFVRPALFRDRNFAAGTLFIGIVGISYLASLALLTPYLQRLMNYPIVLPGSSWGLAGLGRWFR